MQKVRRQISTRHEHPYSNHELSRARGPTYLGTSNRPRARTGTLPRRAHACRKSWALARTHVSCFPNSCPVSTEATTIVTKRTVGSGEERVSIPQKTASAVQRAAKSLAEEGDCSDVVRIAALRKDHDGAEQPTSRRANIRGKTSTSSKLRRDSRSPQPKGSIPADISANTLESTGMISNASTPSACCQP